MIEVMDDRRRDVMTVIVIMIVLKVEVVITVKNEPSDGGMILKATVTTAEAATAVTVTVAVAPPRGLLLPEKSVTIPIVTTKVLTTTTQKDVHDMTRTVVVKMLVDRTGNATIRIVVVAAVVAVAVAVARGLRASDHRDMTRKVVTMIGRTPKVKKVPGNDTIVTVRVIPVASDQPRWRQDILLDSNMRRIFPRRRVPFKPSASEKPRL